jgi:hypothetical protein
MLNRTTRFAAAFVAILLIAGTVSAQYSRWVRLGSAHVDGRIDHDNIRVGISDGAFRAIQLRVHGGRVIFQRVTIRYGNGQLEELPVRFTIPSGGRTRAIDLPGDRRIIQSVDIWYSKAHWATRPTVTLYGLR